MFGKLDADMEGTPLGHVLFMSKIGRHVFSRCIRLDMALW